MPIEELFLKPFLSGKTFIKKKKKKNWCRDGSRAKSQTRDNPANSNKIQLRNQSRVRTEL
jgi:hypothetical protein